MIVTLLMTGSVLLASSHEDLKSYGNQVCHSNEGRETLVKSYLDMEACEKEFRSGHCPIRYSLAEDRPLPPARKISPRFRQLQEEMRKKQEGPRKPGFDFKPGQLVKYREKSTGKVRYGEVATGRSANLIIVDPKEGKRTVGPSDITDVKTVPEMEYQLAALSAIFGDGLIQLKTGERGLISKATAQGLEFVRDEGKSQLQGKVTEKIPWAKIGERVAKVQPKLGYKIGVAGLKSLSRFAATVSTGVPGVMTTALAMALEPTSVGCGEMSQIYLKFPEGSCDPNLVVETTDKFSNDSFEAQLKTLSDPLVCEDFRQHLESRREKLMNTTEEMIAGDTAKNCQDRTGTLSGIGTGMSRYQASHEYGGVAVIKLYLRESAAGESQFIFKYGEDGQLKEVKKTAAPGTGKPARAEAFVLDPSDSNAKRLAQSAWLASRTRNSRCKSAAPVMVEQKTVDEGVN